MPVVSKMVVLKGVWLLNFTCTVSASAKLGNFKNLSDIALAKSEIFYGMKKDGIVILPGESKHLDILKSEARNHGLKNLFFFGTDNNLNITIHIFNLATRFMYYI